MQSMASFLHWAYFYCLCLARCLATLNIYLLASKNYSFKGA